MDNLWSNHNISIQHIKRKIAMRKRGNSFGDWFFMIVMMAALVLILINISKDSQRKPVNFQSWTLSLIWNDYILKPLREL